jgi:hypothetical protein
MLEKVRFSGFVFEFAGKAGTVVGMNQNDENQVGLGIRRRMRAKMIRAEHLRE